MAAIYSVGLWDMSQNVERFQTEHPHAKVHFDYLHPHQVYEHVQDGTADLGLVSFPGRLKGLTVLPWREEEMVVACSPGHPLARRQVVAPRQLEGAKYIAFDTGLDIRREVDHFLAGQGIEVDVVLEFDNIENIKNAIEIGAGLAILPRPPCAWKRRGEACGRCISRAAGWCARWASSIAGTI